MPSPMAIRSRDKIRHPRKALPTFCLIDCGSGAKPERWQRRGSVHLSSPAGLARMRHRPIGQIEQGLVDVAAAPSAADSAIVEMIEVTAVIFDAIVKFDLAFSDPR